MGAVGYQRERFVRFYLFDCWRCCAYVTASHVCAQPWGSVLSSPLAVPLPSHPSPRRPWRQSDSLPRTWRQHCASSGCAEG